VSARDEPLDLRLLPAAAVVWAVAGVAVRLPAGGLLAAASGVVAAVAAWGAASVAGAAAARRRASSGGAGAVVATGRTARARGRTAVARTVARTAARAGGGAGSAADAGRRQGRVDARRGQSGGQVLLVLGAVAVLLLTTAAQVRARETGDLRALAAEGARVRIVGVVRSTPTVLGGPADDAAARDGPADDDAARDGPADDEAARDGPGDHDAVRDGPAGTGGGERAAGAGAAGAVGVAGAAAAAGAVGVAGAAGAVGVEGAAGAVGVAGAAGAVGVEGAAGAVGVAGAARAGTGDDHGRAVVRFLVAARAVQVLDAPGRDGLRSGDDALGAPVATGAAVDVLAPASAAALAYGTQVQVDLRLTPAPDRGARAVARGRALGDVGVRSPPPALLRVTEGLRAGLVVTARGVPGDAGRLLPGLAVGDVRAVGDLDAPMRVSGLAHLTAVSGAHFSLLGGVVLAAAARCRVPRRWRWCPVTVVLAGFVAVVHPGASVVRAAVMGAIGVLGLVAGRPSRTVPALAAAVVVLLVADPWLAADLGFVLSVVATAGIALLAGPLARTWSAGARRVPGERSGAGALATALAVPVAAQAVCAPVVLLLSPAVPLYAVPANLLAAPAVGPATVGGLLAALLAGPWPAAARCCALVAGAGCWWIATVARTAAGLPGAQVAWLGGAAGPVLLAGACAAALVLAVSASRGTLGACHPPPAPPCAGPHAAAPARPHRRGSPGTRWRSPPWSS